MADFAALGFCYRDLLLAAVGGLFKSDFHVVPEIVTALRVSWVLPSAAAKQIFEDATAAENFAEDLERIMESAAPKSARASIESAMAILIVKGAFLGITE